MADTRHGHGLEHDQGVAHTLISDPASEVTIQAGAVVSKVLHRGGGVNVTVFAFDAGEQLTEHKAARTAVVQVLSGHLRFTVDAEELDLDPGSWLHMAPGAPHSLIATEPTVMLLTLIGE
jgi:quercetin dioxygenase-like cupin family protein